MANSKLKGNEIVNIPPNSDLVITVQGEANFLAINEVKPLIPDNANEYTTIHFKLLFEGLIVGDGTIKTGEFFQLSNTPFNQIALSTHNHDFYKGKAIIATISYGAGVFNDTSTEFVNKELPKVVKKLADVEHILISGNTDLAAIRYQDNEMRKYLKSVDIKQSAIITSLNGIRNYVDSTNIRLDKLNNKTASDFPYKSETKSTVAVNEYLTFDLNETDLIKIDVGMNRVTANQSIEYTLEFSNGNANDDFFKLGNLHADDNVGASNGTTPINQTFNTTNWTTLKLKVSYKTGTLVSRLYCNVNSFKK